MKFIQKIYWTRLACDFLLALLCNAITLACAAQSADPGQVPAAVQQKMDSLELLLAQPLTDSMRAEQLFQLARLYGSIDLERDIALRAEAYAIGLKSGNEVLRARMAGLLSLPLINAGRLYEAEKYLNESLAFYKTSKDVTAYAQMLLFAGYLHRKKGQHDKALQYLLQALKIKEETGQSLTDVYNRIGILYFDRKEYSQALNYYFKIDEYYKSIDQPNKHTSSLLNIGQTYLALEQPEKARPYLEKYRYEKSKQNNFNAQALVYTSLSELALLEGNPQQAIIYRDSSRYYFTKLKYKPGIASSFLAKGNIFKDQKAYTQALENMDEAERIAHTSQALDVLLGVYKSKSDIYAALKNYDRAFDFQQQYLQLNDSINNNISAERMAALERDYLMEKAAKDKELLSKDNQLQEIEIEKQRNRQFYLLLMLLFAAGILVMAWNQLRIRKKGQRLLVQKNEIIEQALEEKEYLLKEIHHRVKNNLQIISSLLYLQSQHLEEGHALDALQEGRSRVNSMALIHQNLYQEDNLSGVDVKDYLDKLTNSLFATYKIQKDRVELKTNIEALNLDVDTIIPLALIVNELISNALKYAFPNNQKGQLSVSLIKTEAALVLSVKDDGVGLPENFDARQNDSFGYELIGLFSQKLEAKMEILKSPGTEVILKIAKFKLV